MYSQRVRGGEREGNRLKHGGKHGVGEELRGTATVGSGSCEHILL